MYLDARIIGIGLASRGVEGEGSSRRMEFGIIIPWTGAEDAVELFVKLYERTSSSPSASLSRRILTTRFDLYPLTASLL